MKLNAYTNKRVLITGGSGFIGANLVHALINQGARVNLFLRPQTNTWRLNNILKKTKVYRLDMIDNKSVNQAVKQIKPEIIFHLAAYGAYPTQAEMLPAIQTNILGTVNLLEAARLVKLQSFINTGTSSEYGFKNKPMKETDVLEPTFAYAATKASATLIGQVFSRKFNLPVTTLRPFSVFGNWEESSRFIPTIINSCLHYQPIKLVPGKIVRDFLYVDDMIRAYLLAGLNPDLGGQIFNIGSGRQYSIRETTEKIIKLIGNQVKVIIGTYQPRQWDTNYWVADRSKAKKLLGWQPQFSLERGLTKTIAWWKNAGKVLQLPDRVV